MRSCLVLVLCLATVLAVDVLRANRATYDIAPAGSSLKGKTQGHELIVKAALAALNPSKAADWTEDTFGNAWKEGIFWNDMPDVAGSYTAAFSATFGIAFAGGIHGLTHATHFGCFQYWHAMAPSEFSAGNECLTNADVQALMITVAEKWWKKGMKFLNKCGSADSKGIDRSRFFVGHLLHLIGDSYAQGHTVRNNAGPLPNHAECGEIDYFQGYDGQNGDAHGEKDHVPNNDPAALTGRDKELFDCAVLATTDVLTEYYACVASGPNPAVDCGWTNVLSKLTPHWTVSQIGQTLEAGGTLQTMAKDASACQTFPTLATVCKPSCAGAYGGAKDLATLATFYASGSGGGNAGKGGARISEIIAELDTDANCS